MSFEYEEKDKINLSTLDNFNQNLNQDNSLLSLNNSFSNKIHNMSAQGGWMRNTVDRDINTDFVSGTDNDQKFNSQCTNISGSLATTTTGGGE